VTKGQVNISNMEKRNRPIFGVSRAGTIYDRPGRYVIVVYRTTAHLVNRMSPLGWGAVDVA
jgi:hypothetical protein